MRTVRSTIALLLAFLLAAALCGCAASPSGGQLASTPGSGPAKPVDAADFMSYAGPVFPLTLAQAEPALSADRKVLLDCAPYARTSPVSPASSNIIRKNCPIQQMSPR